MVPTSWNYLEESIGIGKETDIEQYMELKNARKAIRENKTIWEAVSRIIDITENQSVIWRANFSHSS